MRLRACRPRSPGAFGPVADYALAFLAGASGAVVLAAAAVVLYAVKSKLGIDLLRGPSPLHDVFVAMRSLGLV